MDIWRVVSWATFWRLLIGAAGLWLSISSFLSFPFFSLAYLAIATLAILAISRVRPALTGSLSIALLLFLLSPPGCSLLGSNPQLRLDPITAAIYDAPRDKQSSFRSLPVDLTEIDLPIGSSLEAVTARLQRAGFKLWSSPKPPRETGYSFLRSGRQSFPCGESMVVYAEFETNQLVTATAYSKWNMCL